MNGRKLPWRFIQFGFAWGFLISLLLFRIHDSNSQEIPFQDDVLTFSQYSYAEGLPFNPETVIFQDRAGYMWFGSSQGLCRYNGYSFEYFGYDPQKSNSLSNPDASSIYEDERERLWIGTGNGLNCLDKWREKCVQYFHDPNNEQSLSGNRITCLSGGLNRTLWVGTDEGLNRIDLETNTCMRCIHVPPSPDEPLCKVISALYADDRGMVWVGSNENLFRFDTRLSQFSRIEINENKTIEFSLITCILKSRSGKLWIGHYKSGSACLDPDTLQVNHYKCKLDDPHEVHRSLYEDKSGILWIATSSGLLRLNPQTGAWARESYRSERLNSLSSGGVLKVGGERSGAVWVATDNKLNRYDPSRFPFRMIKHNPNDPNSMSANSVFSICEDAKGMIWIGLEDQGLNRYDPQTQTFKQYLHVPDDPTSLSYNTVTALCPDPSGKIWVGTHLRGVCLFDPQTERFKRFPWKKNQGSTPNGIEP